MRLLITVSHIALILLSCFTLNAVAQEAKDSKAASTTPEVKQQLRELAAEIQSYKTKIAGLDTQISKAENEATAAKLETHQADLEAELNNRIYYMEQLATGAVDLSLFEQPDQQQAFSWQTELQDIFKPILYELKTVTERPRQIERLRSRITSLNTRLEATATAIKEIQQLQSSIESPGVQTVLSDILSDWEDRNKQLEAERQLVEFQLNEKASNDESRSSVILNGFKGFLTGRGFNLLLALVAFGITFTGMRYASHVVEQRVARGQNKEDRFFARLIHIILQVLAVLLALFATLATFYALGDWLLLTLLCIMLVGFTFALRNSLPQYIDEARMLLNLGPVREGERVVYQGLPWTISRINIYSDLVNPVLTGGRLRLPLNVMLQLVSRRWSREEPWFPCKPDDYVMMPDSTFGSILMQTPENVQLEVIGGGTKLYPTLDFLAQAPHNMSHGFAIAITFGLDYEEQAKITADIPATLESYITKAVAEQDYGEFVTNLFSEFESAGASSLNLVVVAVFDGEAAGSYFSIRRFLQRAAVDACNENGWNIPFSQVTVHLQNPNSTNEGKKIENR